MAQITGATGAAGAPPEPRAAAEPAGGSGQIHVLGKARQVLDCFTVDRPVLTLGQVRALTGLPGSTSLRLLQTMTREGFLDRDADGYRVGVQMVHWAACVAPAADLGSLLAPVLDRLRDGTDESAFLCVRDRTFRTLVAISPSRQPVIRQLFVGQVMPLHAGSAGKVFLAYEPELLEAVLAEGLTQLTDATIVEPDALRAELGRVRADGFATSVEERERQAASVSAPVFGRDGRLAAVLGVAAPAHRLGPAAARETAPRVVSAAVEASHLLGSPPGRHRGADL